MDIQERPECDTTYVLLSNGYWHHLGKDFASAIPIHEDEYEEFNFWLNEKEAEENENTEQEEEASVQEIKGIEILSYPNERNYGYGPTDIVGLIDHPDGDKQFAITNDDQVHWFINYMLLPLDENELDRFYRWRNGDENALYESVQELKKPEAGEMKKPVLKEQTWKGPDLDAIFEEDEEEAEEAAEVYEVKKWNMWGLYTVEEEDEE